MKYFTIAELCRSNTAQQRKIKNVPGKQQEAALVALVNNVLDPLREKFGRPIIVSSGFRSAELNKTVGGAPTSQHMKGEAADIYTGTKEGNKELFNLIKNNLPFDQLIDENNFAWVHVSFRADGKNRSQVLSL